MRRSSISWLLLVLLFASSAVLSYVRLQSLPELPVSLGPDLTIRATHGEPSMQGSVSTFSRGDRVTAVGGRQLTNLADLRKALLATLEEVDAPPQEPRPIPYQLVRPLHRFNLTLSGEPLDPTALPPGVEEGDMLVELDGRPMRPKVGTEGLRSIISSRPEALLVLERRNAIFSGNLSLTPPELPRSLLILWVVGVVLMLALWRFGHETLPRMTVLMVGAQTLVFTWVTLGMLEYQWVLSDLWLTQLLMVSFVLARPLGIFARSIASESDPPGWGGLGLGALGAIFVITALHLGWFPTYEVALQFSAFLAGLFLIFEIVLTALSESAGTTLGERSFYLAGLLLLVVIVAAVVGSLEPVSFQQSQWRWFALGSLGLMWFGDTLLCLRGLPATAFAEIATSEQRRELIFTYLEELAQDFEFTRPMLIVYRDDRSYAFSLDPDAWVAEWAPQDVHDVVSILHQEDASLPMPPGFDHQSTLIEGLGSALRLIIAQGLAAPRASLRVDGVRLFVLFFLEDEAPEEIEPPSLQDLEYIQQRVTPLTWAAACIESLQLHANEAPAPRPAPEPIEEELEEAPQEAPEPELVRDVVRESALEREIEAMRRWHHPAPPLPANADGLVEPGLLDALEMLTEDPSPLIFAGAAGAGKSFVAHLLHHLEGRSESPCLMYDASAHGPETHLRDLLGSDTSPGVLEICHEGTLIIEHAEFLADEVLLHVSEASERLGVRVALCFTTNAALERSVLEGASVEVLEIFDGREVIIPDFGDREEIMEPVLQSLLEEALFDRDRDDIQGFTQPAFDLLLRYGYPGQIEEARAMIHVSIERARTNVIDANDLPRDVRRRDR